MVQRHDDHDQPAHNVDRVNALFQLVNGVYIGFLPSSFGSGYSTTVNKCKHQARNNILAGKLSFLRFIGNLFMPCGAEEIKKLVVSAGRKHDLGLKRNRRDATKTRYQLF